MSFEMESQPTGNIDKRGEWMVPGVVVRRLRRVIDGFLVVVGIKRLDHLQGAEETVWKSESKQPVPVTVYVLGCLRFGWKVGKLLN
jgi:hypothetical protein